MVADHRGIQCGGLLWNIHLHVNDGMNSNAFALSIYPSRDHLDDALPSKYILEYSVSARVLPSYSNSERPPRLLQHQWTKRTDLVYDRVETENLPFSRDDLIGSQCVDDENHFYLKISIKTKFVHRSRSLICAPYRGMTKSRPQYSGVFGAILLQTEKRLEEVEQKNERLKQKNHDLEQQLIGSNRAQEQFEIQHTAALERVESQLRRLGGRGDETRRLKEKNDHLREQLASVLVCRLGSRKGDHARDTAPVLRNEVGREHGTSVLEESKQQNDRNDEMKLDTMIQSGMTNPTGAVLQQKKLIGPQAATVQMELNCDTQNDELQFVYGSAMVWRHDSAEEKWINHEKGQVLLYWNKVAGRGKLMFVDDRDNKVRLLQWLSGHKHCEYKPVRVRHGAPKLDKEQVQWKGTDFRTGRQNWCRLEFTGNEGAATQFMAVFNELIDRQSQDGITSDRNGNISSDKVIGRFDIQALCEWERDSKTGEEDELKDISDAASIEFHRNRRTTKISLICTEKNSNVVLLSHVVPNPKEAQVDHSELRDSVYWRAVDTIYLPKTQREFCCVFEDEKTAMKFEVMLRAATTNNVKDLWTAISAWPAFKSLTSDKPVAKEKKPKGSQDGKVGSDNSRTKWSFDGKFESLFGASTTNTALDHGDVRTMNTPFTPDTADAIAKLSTNDWNKSFGWNDQGGDDEKEDAVNQEKTNLKTNAVATKQSDEPTVNSQKIEKTESSKNEVSDIQDVSNSQFLFQREDVHPTETLTDSPFVNRGDVGPNFAWVPSFGRPSAELPKEHLRTRCITETNKLVGKKDKKGDEISAVNVGSDGCTEKPNGGKPQKQAASVVSSFDWNANRVMKEKGTPSILEDSDDRKEEKSKNKSEGRGGSIWGDVAGGFSLVTPPEGWGNVKWGNGNAGNSGGFGSFENANNVNFNVDSTEIEEKPVEAVQPKESETNSAATQNEVKADDEDNMVECTFKPIVQLEEVEVAAGTEGDIKMNSFKIVKLYRWGKDVTGDSGWKDRATNTTIDFWQQPNKGKVRVICRENVTNRLRMNHWIPTSKIANVQLRADKFVQWSGFDTTIHEEDADDNNELCLFNCKFVDVKTAKEFYKALVTCIRNNERLAEKKQES